MPTYEYICDACQHEFEQFQSIKAPPVKVCPTCKKKKVRRKISSGAGILFKGGGFYETDYRSAGYNESKKKDTEGSASPDKSDTKSETKADAKSPAKSEPAAPAKAETPKADRKESGHKSKSSSE